MHDDSLAPSGSAPTARATRARVGRADGDQTRAAIIEAAGELFAERGRDGATSKAICARAQVNPAAINYHFGGLDGLYLAVLKEVHARVLSVDELQQIVQGPGDAAAKLTRVLRVLVGHVLGAQQWPTRIWAREILAPTAALDRLFVEDIPPKFGLLAQLMHDLTGIAVDDPAMRQLVLSTLSPWFTLLLAGPHRPTPFQPLFHADPDELAQQLARFALAGLRASASGTE